MSLESTHGVRLDQFLPSSRISGPAGVKVQGCTSDPRKIRPGDAFVAILGDEHDGHDQVTQAVARGAAAVVVEQPVPVFNVPVHLVEDSRQALGAICHELAGAPSRQIRVIGVIGTQGKSTVAALLESIFTAAGCDVGVLSSLKTYDGMTCGPGATGPLSPTNVAARLARMEAFGCTHAIVELSSVDLAQRRTAGLVLDTVVGTSVDSARLDVHQNPQNYRQALRRAFDQLAPEGLAILNADDAVSCRWLADLSAPSLTYGVKADAQVTAEIIDRNACETVFVLTAGCESAAIRTTIIGDHHVANCLAAATVAVAHNIDLQTVAAGIESLTRLDARMERIDCGQDYAVFVDAAENPTGLRAALRSARQISHGRVICVLGDRPTACCSEAETIRSVVRKLADLAIVTDAVLDAHAGWLADAQMDSSIQRAADRGEAIAWALAAADPGDVVVIAGSRGTTGSTFGANGECEADAIRSLLYSCAGSVASLRVAG